MQMSARRQPSTTSLAKFARAGSPIPPNRSLDFCNSFWGVSDGGVEVLFARMRGASRTMEELKAFWKERAAIEDDYAKRLTKLSKVTLGKDEIGELRISLDTVRLETDKQAGFHQTLAQQIRNELEGQTASFHMKQQQHKKIYQAAIEKAYKAKQTQETYVNKSREKYEQDCMRINSYTAQSSLVQGKDLEKVTLKLERAQQTVQANERDFANFAKALQDTVAKWEVDWKAFCDTCQDLEEQRIEFMKDNLWAYANAVSTVCVADDESCEQMRLALERTEPEKEMENFVRDYGTGNQIPDPPSFVNYNTPEAIPSSSSRPTTRPANFQRASQREPPLRQNSIPLQDDEPTVNTAGVGAGGGRGRSNTDTEGSSPLTRQPTQAGSSQVNGHSSMYNSPAAGPSSSSPPTSSNLQRQFTTATQIQSSRVPPQDPNAEVIDPTAETYIKVGNNAYKVDLSKDPQQTGPLLHPIALANGEDPLAQRLQELQNAVSTTGSIRKNTMRQSMDAKNVASARKSPTPGGSLSLPPPSAASGSQTANPRDYRNSAELVPSTSPAGGVEVVQEVLADYHQALPGERRSISANSRRGSFVAAQPAGGSVSPVAGLNHGHSHSLSQGQNLARPSSVGHAGIGAHGSRSNSPQPLSRGPSPVPANQARNTYMAPPSQVVVRATSPNNVGIALDPSGRVLHDDMAQMYQQHHQQQQQQQHQQQPQQRQPSYNPPPPPPLVQQPPPPQPVQQQQQQQQRANSYVPPVSPAVAPAAPVQPAYAASSPAPGMMYQQPPPQPSYAQPPPAAQPVYSTSPAHYQPPPQQQPMYQQQQQPQQPQQQQHSPYGSVNGLQRGGSVAGGYYNTPPQQQQQSGGYGGYQSYHEPSPSPSPQPPPPQAAVKALYDYTATIDEEFDFQAGDIIAVTATPEDGWWSGELLDETRRQRGRHVFPSNFVCLF
ncbi:hypothetical protein BDQ17DRAFT_1321593 [Cyathus striatus]|nr:hypothetical protein BDQ17DRAFT_1321593 [Cyathus striatus]